MDFNSIKSAGLKALIDNDDSGIYVEMEELKKPGTLAYDYSDRENYKDDYILVDIRSSDEFAGQNYPESVNVPYQSEGRFRENLYSRYKYRESINIIIVAKGKEDVHSAISQLIPLEERMDVRVKVLKGGMK